MAIRTFACSVFAIAFLTACGPGEEYGDARDDAPPSAAQSQAENGMGAARERPSPQAPGGASEFVERAAQSGLLEIETGRLAAQRAQSAEVREFAELMIADHSKAAEDLKSAAQRAQITPPAQLDDEHRRKLEDIRNASADNFDKDYLDLQEEAHERAVSQFETYVKTGDSAELRTFASTALPVLRGHLTRVREIREGFDLGDDALGAGSGEDETP